MTAKRAAAFLGIEPETLRGWHRSGVGPPRARLGKRYWYARLALIEWLKGGATVMPSVRAELARAQGTRLQGRAQGGGWATGPTTRVD